MYVIISLSARHCVPIALFLVYTFVTAIIVNFLLVVVVVVVVVVAVVVASACFILLILYLVCRLNVVVEIFDSIVVE